MSDYPADSDIVGLTTAGNFVFFAAEDAVHGVELWKTDGTPAGTSLVKDINPGPDPAFTNQQYGLTNLNGLLLFWATDGVHGIELWKSDGTESGTGMVKDISPGNGTRANFKLSDADLTMKVINGVVYFPIQADNNIGVELWKSDGTEARTVRVKVIDPTGNSSGAPNDMFDFNGVLYFSADDGVNGRELWKSDGTETVMVKDINPDGSSSPREMAVYNGKLFFSANDGVNGWELWSTDGTEANTSMFLDIHFTGSSFPQNLAEINGSLYFSAADTTTGQEPWISNGEPTWGAGTKRFASMSRVSSRPAHFTEFNGSVYFSARGDLGTNYSDPGSFWKTDGTLEGTLALGSGILPTEIVVMGEKMYLLSDGYVSRDTNEIWVSDGTAEGTEPVSAQYPGTRVGSTGEAAILNGVFITVGYDETHGNELWAYDPAGSGPVLLKNIHPGSAGTYFGANSGDAPFAEINGVGFFAAMDNREDGPTSGNELWKSDGTPAGTSLVKDINPGEADSYPLDFHNVNGVLLFTADDGTHGRELWLSDGTEPGTAMLKEFTETSPFDTEFGGFAVVGNELYFSAYNLVDHSMLWKSDGTKEGTVLIKRIFPGARNLYIREMIGYQGKLIFAAMDDQDTGIELWISDGTETGTVLLKDINESGHSNPGRFIIVDDTLFFIAQHVNNDVDLWKTDGTPEGTVMVRDFSAVEGGGPREMVSFKGALFFSGRDGGTGQGLWTSDGTSEGTKEVSTVFPDSYAYSMWDLVAGDDHILFLANEKSLIESTRFFRSDGTTAGTEPITINLPNEADVEYYLVSQMTPAHGFIYFTIEDEVYGREVWLTDGTDEGTQLFIDLYPGPGDSRAKILGVIGERGTEAETLLFGGDDHLHGSELWKVGGAPELEPSSFLEWREAQFTAEQLLDTEITGPDGDPDGDGITNLREYVHNLSPNQANASPVEIQLSNNPQNEIDGVTVTFTWSKTVTNVAYELQISTDLGTWETLVSEVISTVRQPLSNLITLWAEPIDIGAIDTFVRLRIFELE